MRAGVIVLQTEAWDTILETFRTLDRSGAAVAYVADHRAPRPGARLGHGPRPRRRRPTRPTRSRHGAPAGVRRGVEAAERTREAGYDEVVVYWPDRDPASDFAGDPEVLLEGLEQVAAL